MGQRGLLHGAAHPRRWVARHVGDPGARGHASGGCKKTACVYRGIGRCRCGTVWHGQGSEHKKRIVKPDAAGPISRAMSVSWCVAGRGPLRRGYHAGGWIAHLEVVRRDVVGRPNAAPGPAPRLRACGRRCVIKFKVQFDVLRHDFEVRRHVRVNLVRAHAQAREQAFLEPEVITELAAEPLSTSVKRCSRGRCLHIIDQPVELLDERGMLTVHLGQPDLQRTVEHQGNWFGFLRSHGSMRRAPAGTDGLACHSGSAGPDGH